MDMIVDSNTRNTRWNPAPVEGGWMISAPSKARATGAQIFISADQAEQVSVLVRGFNPRTEPEIEGPAVAWAYSDGHAMVLVAVLRRGHDFNLWMPGQHGHGPGRRYAGRVSEDGSIVLARVLEMIERPLVCGCVGMAERSAVQGDWARCVHGWGQLV